MTIVCTTVAILMWLGFNVTEKNERAELRARLTQYGSGEVVG